MKPNLPDHLSPNRLQYSSPITHYELMKKVIIRRSFVEIVVIPTVGIVSQVKLNQLKLIHDLNY